MVHHLQFELCAKHNTYNKAYIIAVAGIRQNDCIVSRQQLLGYFRFQGLLISVKKSEVLLYSKKRTEASPRLTMGGICLPASTEFKTQDKYQFYEVHCWNFLGSVLKYN
jgi:hypothetical protein